MHTPGPWAIDDWCWIDAPSGMNVATISAGLDAEETVANAKLIAAAPDLLAALKDMLGSTGSEQACAAAHAAIAKAGSK